MGTTRSDQTDFRKITHNSSGTSSVSIPMPYIRALGWRKGQRVRLVRKGNQLVIQPVVGRSRFRHPSR